MSLANLVVVSTNAIKTGNEVHTKNKYSKNTEQKNGFEVLCFIFKVYHSYVLLP